MSFLIAAMDSLETQVASGVERLVRSQRERSRETPEVFPLLSEALFPRRAIHGLRNGEADLPLPVDEDRRPASEYKGSTRGIGRVQRRLFVHLDQFRHDLSLQR